VTIESCTTTSEDWLRLRRLLWPEVSDDDHRRSMAGIIAQPERFLVLVARSESGTAAGLAEASIRHDFVNGCDTSPVAFLEGIFVIPEARRQGVARNLCAWVEDWARRNHCVEFASDADIANYESHAMHRALGFHEMERVVYFRKELPAVTSPRVDN